MYTESQNLNSNESSSTLIDTKELQKYTWIVESSWSIYILQFFSWYGIPCVYTHTLDI
jgi:hypothetical protein